MGHGVPSEARIGHRVAAASWWQLGFGVDAAGRCAGQQSRGTSAESDATWHTIQMVTQSRMLRLMECMCVGSAYPTARPPINPRRPSSTRRPPGG